MDNNNTPARQLSSLNSQSHLHNELIKLCENKKVENLIPACVRLTLPKSTIGRAR